MRYCKDAHEAKDILQESFIKIFNNIQSFDGDLIQLEKWMTKIAVNSALENYRKQKKIFYTEEVFLCVENYMLPKIIDKLDYEEFKFIIAKLPNDLRITFNLSYVEGYKHKEIAAMLGIKESSSRTRLTRAKKLLRELFINAKMIEYVR